MDGRVTPWRAVAASVAGSSHRARGAECQDACALHVDGETLVVAVSDGAGSARRADLASRLVCDAFVDEGRRQACQPDESDAGAVVDRLRALLLDAARAHDEPPREFACTLLGAVVTPAWSLFVQVGDGAIVTDHAEGFAPIFWPSHGEYVNETHFLTDAEAQHVRSRVTRSRPARLALFTDGLERVALRLADRAAHEPFFAPLFAALDAAEDEAVLAGALHAWLASDALAARTDDDLTLVLASSAAPPAPEVPERS